MQKLFQAGSLSPCALAASVASQEGFSERPAGASFPHSSGNTPTPSLPRPSRSCRLKDSLCTVSRVRRRWLPLRPALPSDDFVAAWSSQGGGRLRSQLAAPDRNRRLWDPRTLLG